MIGESVAGPVHPVPHSRGDVIAWRSVRTYGPLGPRVGAAFAGIVIADTPDLQVFCTPAGSEKLSRAGVGRGPNGRQIPSTEWDGTHRRGVWEGPGTVRVHRPGDSWSIWRSHDGEEWTAGWYGNLEEPWTRTTIGFDSQDWVLDVVAEGTPGTSAFTVGYKDQDELEYFVEVGETSRESADRIRAVGTELTTVSREGRWPLDADWDAWIPDPAWGSVALPTDVAVLGSPPA